MEYYSAIKKNECSNTDGPRDYHTQWNKSETNITWYCLYVESLKKRIKWTYLKNWNRLTDLENKLMIVKGKR